MTDETTKNIKLAIRALGANRYKKVKPWKGYEVYKPVYTEFAFRGHPYVVLVKGDRVRLSTPEESIEYLGFSTPPGEDDED